MRERTQRRIAGTEAILGRACPTEGSKQVFQRGRCADRAAVKPKRSNAGLPAWRWHHACCSASARTASQQGLSIALPSAASQARKSRWEAGVHMGCHRGGMPQVQNHSVLCLAFAQQLQSTGCQACSTPPWHVICRLCNMADSWYRPASAVTNGMLQCSLCRQGRA